MRLDRPAKVRYAAGTTLDKDRGRHMSSTSNRQPDFRLVFGYPNVVTLWRRGETEPVGSADAGSPGFLADLRALAAEVRARRGRLTAVLPEAEVWRGRLALVGRTPVSRRRDARETIAGVFGEPAEAVHVVLGRPGRDGAWPVAGVRRATLDELRGLRGQVGLAATTVIGAGGFPGFAAPPPLRTGMRLAGFEMPELALPALRLPQLPSLSGLRPARGLSLGTTGIGALTAAAGVFLLVASPRPAPVAGAPDAVDPLAAALPPAVVAAPVELAELTVLPPPAAPVSLALHTSPRPPARPTLPAAVLDAGRLGTPVTMATRNVDFTEPQPGQAPKIRLPAIPAAAPRRAETAEPPTPRPEAPKAAEVAPQTDLDLRPVKRPAAKPAASAAAKPATAPKPELHVSAAPAPGERPAPRPVAVAPLVVAALTPSTEILTDAPPARPAPVVKAAAAPKPAPAPKPTPKPTVVKPLVEAAVAKPAAAPKPAPAPKPVVVAAPVPQAKPAVVAVAAPKPVSIPVVAPAKQLVAAKPAPAPAVRTAAVIPTVREVTPVRVAKPAPQPVRTASAAQPTVRKTTPKPEKARFASASPSKSGMSLIGVFGGQDGRHALVLMPDGSIERVRAGDSVRGVQIAAIDATSVRLTGAGRDATLHLPE